MKGRERSQGPGLVINWLLTLQIWLSIENHLHTFYLKWVVTHRCGLWRTDSRVLSGGPCGLWFHSPVPLSALGQVTSVTCFLPTESCYGKGSTFYEITLHKVAMPAFLKISLPCGLEGSQKPYWKAQVGGNLVQHLNKASRKLRPLAGQARRTWKLQCPCGLGSRSSLCQPQVRPQPLAKAFITPWWDPEQGTRLCWAWTPDPQELRDNKCIVLSLHVCNAHL